MAATKNSSTPNVQLTVRLEPDIIQLLDEISSKMQKNTIAGVKITRTDGLRAAIICGVESLSGRKLRNKTK